jgi:hypothetical protein
VRDFARLPIGAGDPLARIGQIHDDAVRMLAHRRLFVGGLLDTARADPGVVDLDNLRQKQRDTAERRRTRPRLHERVDVRQFLI